MSVFEDLWAHLKEAARRTVRADQSVNAQQAQMIVEETLRKLRLEGVALDVRDYFVRSLLELVEDERRGRDGPQNPT